MISGSGSTLFEELGLYYIGPVDGHKMSDLVDVLQGALPSLRVLPCHHWQVARSKTSQRSPSLSFSDLWVPCAIACCPVQWTSTYAHGCVLPVLQM